MAGWGDVMLKGRHYPACDAVVSVTIV